MALCLYSKTQDVHISLACNVHQLDNVPQLCTLNCIACSVVSQ